MTLEAALAAFFPSTDAIATSSDSTSSSCFLAFHLDALLAQNLSCGMLQPR